MVAYRPRCGWRNQGESVGIVLLAFRKEGITLEGHEMLKEQFQKDLPTLNYEKSIVIRNALIEFVKVQGSACNENERLIGSSEIIESVFWKAEIY